MTRTSRSRSGSKRRSARGEPRRARIAIYSAAAGALVVLLMAGFLVVAARRDPAGTSREGERVAAAPEAVRGTGPIGPVRQLGIPVVPLDQRATLPAPAAQAAKGARGTSSSWPAAWAAELDGLRRSGAMAPEPAARAEAIFAAWRGRRADGVEAIEDGGCHRAGCFVTLTFADLHAAERFNGLVATPDDPSSAWLGPRQQLEPLQEPGGRVKATWILLPEPERRAGP